MMPDIGPGDQLYFAPAYTVESQPNVVVMRCFADTRELWEARMSADDAATLVDMLKRHARKARRRHQ